ncbi:YrhK family protein [Bacillus salacetis]|uniref:YrhK family protein n=1 Tax=Bacillus salacetis TaxID=2315464 RepID=UPI003BA28604
MLKGLKNRMEEFDDNSVQIYLSKKRKMVIRNRYQIIGYLNDILLGILYMIGSILFVTDSDRILAVSFFLAGSFLMIFRAIINILRDIHLKRFTKEDFQEHNY